MINRNQGPCRNASDGVQPVMGRVDGFSIPFALGTACLLAVVSATFLLWPGGSEVLSRENGPLENLQAGFLFLGAGFWIGRSWMWADGSARFFARTMALFFGTFLVLEVDLRGSGPEWVRVVFNGWVRDLWLIVLWVAVLWGIHRHGWRVWALFEHWLRHRSGALMLFAGGFWLSSALIDKSIIVKKDLFKEELTEVNAALLMLLSALSVPAVMEFKSPIPSEKSKDKTGSRWLSRWMLRNADSQRASRE